MLWARKHQNRRDSKHQTQEKPKEHTVSLGPYSRPRDFDGFLVQLQEIEKLIEVNRSFHTARGLHALHRRLRTLSVDAGVYLTTKVRAREPSLDKPAIYNQEYIRLLWLVCPSGDWDANSRYMRGLWAAREDKVVHYMAEQLETECKVWNRRVMKEEGFDKKLGNFLSLMYACHHRLAKNRYDLAQKELTNLLRDDHHRSNTQVGSEKNNQQSRSFGCWGSCSTVSTGHSVDPPSRPKARLDRKVRQPTESRVSIPAVVAASRKDRSISTAVRPPNSRTASCVNSITSRYTTNKVDFKSVPYKHQEDDDNEDTGSVLPSTRTSSSRSNSASSRTQSSSRMPSSRTATSNGNALLFDGQSNVIENSTSRRAKFVKTHGEIGISNGHKAKARGKLTI